ncbi:molybdopterin molybdotransferase MoeA [Zhihengliuella flava]|uniref:Molybdopterin molybdenumtransferase n=1 Tax=Zhihengliuella flava TaxID=1285193 RepID=A0A931D6B5_9MICC|nr:molybdopterin molybdotransferase MoeA [Zhihengliuella flava]MBG6085244.1 molybdopterin molybdotransferase [Zhihengliuella flava]
MPNVPWQHARELAHAAGAATPRQRHNVGLNQAVNRVLAADVVAPTDIPHFRASAMDGWAVSGEGPWTVLPGEARSTPRLRPGTAVPIHTGSPVPEGTSAVLRREQAVLNSEASSGAAAGFGAAASSAQLSAQQPLAAHADIRPAGREAAAGERLFAAGTRLTPGHLAAAAVAGCDVLRVYRAPRAALVLTGDEVVAEGQPAHGHVRDAFSPVLPPAIAHLGAEVLATNRIGDHRAQTVDALGRDDVDLIVTTGGTGRSPVDHLRPALQTLGAELIVDEIAMRPGHPALLARRADGVLVAGLPGNPLAAVAAFVTLVQPLLAGLVASPLEPLARAAALETFAPLPGRERLVPARLHTGPGGTSVDAAALRGSAMLRGLADSTCLMVIPPEGVEAGEPVPYVELPWTTYSSVSTLPRS